MLGGMDGWMKETVPDDWKRACEWATKSVVVWCLFIWKSISEQLISLDAMIRCPTERGFKDIANMQPSDFASTNVQ